MKAFTSQSMKSSLKAALLGSVFIAYGCAPQEQNFGSVQGLQENSNIVGGVLATSDFQKANGIVQLKIFTQTQNSEGTATCTGSLIAPTVVLTAAHCLAADADSKIVGVAVIFATSDQGLTKANVRQAVAGAINPNFKPNDLGGSWNDIALLRLDSAAPADFQLAKIPNSNEQTLVQKGSLLTLAGFGITTPMVRKIQKDRLGRSRVVELPTAGAGTLRKIDKVLVADLNVDRSELVLDQSSSNGACHGDSGGPAFLTQKDGSQLVVGVTSRGVDKLGNCVGQTIYTAVSAHTSWIASVQAKWAQAANQQPVAAK